MMKNALEYTLKVSGLLTHIHTHKNAYIHQTCHSHRGGGDCDRETPPRGVAGCTRGVNIRGEFNKLLMDSDGDCCCSMFCSFVDNDCVRRGVEKELEKDESAAPDVRDA